MNFEGYNAYTHAQNEHQNDIAACESTNTQNKRSSLHQEYPSFQSTSQTIGPEDYELIKNNHGANEPQSYFSSSNQPNYPAPMAPLNPENQISRKSNTITADKNVNAPKLVQEYHMKKYPEQSYQSSRLENMGKSTPQLLH
jgi:hypothetical protein